MVLLSLIFVVAWLKLAVLQKHVTLMPRGMLTFGVKGSFSEGTTAYCFTVFALACTAVIAIV